VNRHEVATTELDSINNGEYEEEEGELENSWEEVKKAELALVRKEAQGLARFVRFIDDGFSLNNKHFDRHKAFYPSCLKISTASSNADGEMVVFMDLNIIQNPQTPYDIVTTLYDKRRGAEYTNVPRIYYTHGTTFLAGFQIGSNTVSSQYHRFRRLINDRQNFILECAIMLAKLVTVCHIPPEPLVRKLKSMLNRFPYEHGDTGTHGNTASRVTTPHGNYLGIAGLYNAAIKEPDPVNWLVEQTPQIIAERRLQAEAEAEKRRRTA
jgi:hypothetical protein